MNSTPNTKDVLIARADEQLARAYEQIARADEEIVDREQDLSHAATVTLAAKWQAQ